MMYPQKSAEDKVYQALRRHLSSPYEVIPATPYLTGEENSPLRQGEFDMLVFHPEEGILLIEIKGGGIYYEGTSRKWYSMDRHEKAHYIKDPFEQAQKAERWLLKAIGDSRIFDKGDCPIPVGHAVFFPDIKWGNEPLPAHAVRGTILDSSHFLGLEAGILGVLRMFRSDRHSRLTDKEASLVKQRILFPCCRVMPSLKSRIERDEFDLISMTEEQIRLLDMFEGTRQIAIEGYAGTGKTQMAMEKAKRLYCQGMTVALLCYNRPLAEEMKRMLISFSDRLYVNSYHGLCDDMCREAGIPFKVPPKGSPEAQLFWKEAVPLMMVDATAKLGKKYDALIVDEGQDIMPFWWETLLDLVKDKDKGHFYIFFDSRQSIYQGKIDLPVQVAPLVLKTNCRNTRAIGELVCRMGGVTMSWPGFAVEGEPPTFISYYSEADQLKKIEACVDDLVNKKNLSPKDIVCLSTHSRKKSCLGETSKLAGIEVTEEILLPGDKIRFSTLHRFKGLEANVVLLCDVSGESERIGEEHLYVGTSRAKHKISIFHHRDFSVQDFLQGGPSAPGRSSR